MRTYFHWPEVEHDHHVRLRTTIAGATATFHLSSADSVADLVVSTGSHVVASIIWYLDTDGEWPVGRDNMHINADSDTDRAILRRALARFIRCETLLPDAMNAIRAGLDALRVDPSPAVGMPRPEFRHYGREGAYLGDDEIEAILVVGHDRRSYAALSAAIRATTRQRGPIERVWATFRTSCGCPGHEHEQEHRYPLVIHGRAPGGLWAVECPTDDCYLLAPCAEREDCHAWVWNRADPHTPEAVPALRCALPW